MLVVSKILSLPRPSSFNKVCVDSIAYNELNTFGWVSDMKTDVLFFSIRSIGLSFLLIASAGAYQDPTKNSVSLKGSPTDGSAVDIADRRELFVDDLLIGKMTETQLKLHSPQKLRRQPPRPFGHYATVLYEPLLDDGGKLRLYYRGDKVPGAHWRNGWAKYHEGEVTLYAESVDGGWTWNEPDLKIHRVPEMPKGNVVLDMSKDTFGVTHNFTPFIDSRPDVPKNESYKALGGIKFPLPNWGGWKEGEREAVVKQYGDDGLKAFASSDGLSWKLLKKQPVISTKWGNFDSQNVAFWSKAEQQYVCYFRWFDKGWRSIRRTTSKDFLNWTEPVEMQGREPKEHLYTNGTHPYFRAPHIYIALPTRFQASAGSITDICLMSTRPGSDRYHRQFKEAFIRPGLGPRGWSNRANYITLNVVPTSSTEMSMFMFGGAQYVLRMDGFISVHAGFKPGIFETKPIRFSGSKLEINYSTSGAGSIKVELIDEDRNPIEGFRLDDCDAIKGDAIAGRVTWKNRSDVSELAGKPIILRFVMSEADLYSLRFPKAD